MRPLARFRARSLGMCDASSSDHPVYGTRMNDLITAKTISVLEFSAVEVGHSRQADVRMGSHVDTFSGHEFGRTRLIKEDEWSHHLPI